MAWEKRKTWTPPQQRGTPPCAERDAPHGINVFHKLKVMGLLYQALLSRELVHSTKDRRSTGLNDGCDNLESLEVPAEASRFVCPH